MEKLKLSYILNLVFFVIVAVCLTACSTFYPNKRIELAEKIAYQSNLESFVIETPIFDLFGYYKVANSSSEASIYIEGDGLSWIDKWTVSNNPTPLNPLALKLASLDSSTKVIYLARPCQYLDLNYEKNCLPKYWTSHQFSKEILDLYQQALNQIKERFQVDTFHIVGFSGGAAIAIMLAGDREDIKTLRTIAGNLDHISLNTFKKVNPLSGSLDTMNYAMKTKKIPQIHYYGGKDKIIPSWITKNYLKTINHTSCVSILEVIEASHLEGWEKSWRKFNQNFPKCLK